MKDQNAKLTRLKAATMAHHAAKAHSPAALGPLEMEGYGGQFISEI